MPTTMPVGEHWSPTAVITVCTILAALFAGTVVPAIIALLNAKAAKRSAEIAVAGTMTAAATAGEAKGKSEANAAAIGTLSRTNEQQQGVLNKMQQDTPAKE